MIAPALWSDPSVWISLAALVISLGFAIFAYRQAKAAQQSTAIQAREEQAAIVAAASAELRANIVIEGSHFALVIQNVGSDVARQVQVMFDGQPASQSPRVWVNDKGLAPFALIAAGAKVRLGLLGLGSPPSTSQVEITWQDGRPGGRGVWVSSVGWG